MIYFNNETRDQVVNKIFDLLKPGGYLFVSHSESLVGINTQLKMDTVYPNYLKIMGQKNNVLTLFLNGNGQANLAALNVGRKAIVP
jgi:predicted methyltransferase